MGNNTIGTEWWHLAWSDAAVLVGQSSGNNDRRAVGAVGSLAKLRAFLEASLISQTYAATHVAKLYLWTAMTRALWKHGKGHGISAVMPCAKTAKSLLGLE